jgi:pyruvate formate lyase activating enzyme
MKTNETAATSIKGLIFDIQRFSLHDGQGIRTLVFTKGCPLRCIWCANPEGLQNHTDILWKPEKCIGCGLCHKAWPKKAIDEKNFGIRRDRCNRCGKCAKCCPTSAKSECGEYKTPQEIVDMAMRDLPFYKNSGGGLTMGGGEILMQPQFTYETLRCAKEAGLSTAIETSGMGSWDWLDKISDYCDTIHYDMKAMNRETHMMLTGVSNDVILRNLQALNDKLIKLPEENRAKLVIRLPLVEGYNDNQLNVEEISEYLKANVPALTRVEILPFHNFGERKYNQLDMKYSLAGKPNASRDAFDHLACDIRDKGIQTHVNSW